MAINEYDIFKNNLETLEELSKDNNQKDSVSYMVNLKERAIDFDEIKRKYANSFGITEEVLGSVDAVLSVDNKVYFIEFKNGEIAAKTKKDIKKKIYSSLLIFLDIIKNNLDYARNNIEFILVYNEDKNDTGKNKIDSALNAKRKNEEPLFGMNMLKKIFFKNVFTLCKREFENFINEIT